MSNDLIIPPSGQDIVSASDDLSRVVYKALQQIEKILDEDMPMDDQGKPNKSDPNYIKMLSVKKDAASSIINAGLKADENRFRRENKDIIERLFDKIKKESRMVDGRVIHKV